MRMSKRQGGYTPLELTAVIAMTGTLAALALPRYVDMARGAVSESARIYHMKWMMARSPAAPTVLDDVPMNQTGYPTSAGIRVAAGNSDSYDTHAAGVIAAATQHPECRLVYAPDTGTSVVHYGDGPNC